MVVGSFSYTVVSVYASVSAGTGSAAPVAPAATAAAARAASELQPPRREHHGRHGHHERHGRHERHTGHGGLGEAIRSAFRDLVPATAKPAAAQGVDGFAQALWQAVRGTPAATQRQTRYGDLAERLDALAESIGALPALTPSASTPAAAAPADGASLVDAFDTMLKALGAAGSAEARPLLARFLHRIAEAAGGSGVPVCTAPPGQLVDTRA